MISYSVCIVDDEESIRQGIADALADRYAVRNFSSAEAALEAIMTAARWIQTGDAQVVVGLLVSGAVAAHGDGKETVVSSFTRALVFEVKGRPNRMEKG